MSAEAKAVARRKFSAAIGASLASGASLCMLAAAVAEPRPNPLSPGLAAASHAIILAQGRGRDPDSAKPPAADDSLETRFWNTIKDTRSAADFHTYLDAYPDGRYAALARARLQQIEGKDGAPGGSRPPPVKPAAEAGGANAPNIARDCEQCPQLALIPAGVFTMGSTEMFPFEGPVHQVTIRKPFYIGRREVTLDEWDACAAEGGCAYSPIRPGGGGSFPATNLDWSDAQQYLVWLTRKTGKTYRLPSESEWEYAARAGSATAYPWGRKMEPNRANCTGCDAEPNNGPVATGSYPPNGFGLSDMAGNAAEWVEDCWSDSYKFAPTDGSALTGSRCQERVLRGGSFNNDPRYLRSASRFKYDYDVRYYTNGFRVVRER